MHGGEGLALSTYYFIVCDDHKERTDAASRSAGGYGALVDSPKTLTAFIIAHCGCKIRIVSEYEDAGYSEDFRDWTSETVSEEITRAQEDDRWR
jgi:hypothetical protein